MSKKRLYRNTEEKMLAGVLAGLADYFGGDATLWRIGFVLLCIATGFFPFVLGYLVAWVVMPVRPQVEPLDTDSYVVYD